MSFYVLTTTECNLSFICLQCACSTVEPESHPVQGRLWWGCNESRPDLRLNLMNSSAGIWFIISCIAFTYTDDKFAVFCCNLPL